MFGSLFRPYGRVWTFCNRLTDVLGLSLLWCLFALPILTVAPATTALYDAAVHGIVRQEGGTYRRFFRTFRQEWKLGLLVNLLWGAVLLFGAFVLTLLDEIGQTDSTAAIMAGGYRVLMLLPLAALCWSAAIQSRFVMGFRELTVTAVRFLPMHLPSSIVIAVITWLTAWFCTNYPIALTYAPSLCAVAWSLAAERVFRKYCEELAEQEEQAD